jgi:hypothetical protein
MGKKPVFKPLERHKFRINVNAVKKYLFRTLYPLQAIFENFGIYQTDYSRKHNGQMKF